MGIVRSGWRDILSFVAQGFGMRAASRNFFFYSTQLNANYGEGGGESAYLHVNERGGK